MKSNRILLFLPFIAVLLLIGLWTSLQRLGWPLPGWDGSLMRHGQLMIIGFLSSLIALERAVALQKKWTFSAPVLFFSGAVFSLVPGFENLGYTLLVLGSFVFFAVMLYLVTKQTTNFNLVMAGAAGLLLLGNILWSVGKPIPEIVFYWIGFLTLTIVGERLELTRLMPIKKSSKFIGHIFILSVFTSIILTSFLPEYGARLFGIMIIHLAAWLLLNDIARKTIKSEGQARFTATGLLLGYFWLLVSGILLVVFGFSFAGPYYDAFTHAIFLGFVFGMIFVHAPIIFPAVFGQSIEFSKRFYIHLYLLQITLLGRIYSDIVLDMELRMWFGLLNALVILLFLGNTVLSVFLAKKKEGNAD